MTIRDRIWHAAYCRWFDNREAGHSKRAAAWGQIADTLCRVFWRPGLPR